MKRILVRLVLLAAMVALSGCYYEPGYGYVRRTGYGGDVYYGQATPVYQGGYYPYGSYDNGYYGCCSVGIIGGWYGGYGGPRYYGGRGYYPGRYGYGYGGGHWQGRPGYGGGRGNSGHPGYSGGHGGGHSSQGGSSHGGGNQGSH